MFAVILCKYYRFFMSVFEYAAYWLVSLLGIFILIPLLAVLIPFLLLILGLFNGKNKLPKNNRNE